MKCILICIIMYIYITSEWLYLLYNPGGSIGVIVLVSCSHAP